ncbi:MAG: carbohydrate binding family 9 domain-containing protein [Krumholzibacteria bacterium]|nr:carbohydrate binding family 9 domain-containing protein [Candidatus Krumholzibacteria bacterium]
MLRCLRGPFRSLSLLALVLAGAVPAGAAVPSFAPTGSGPQHAQASNGTLTPLPTLQAHRVPAGAVTLDGRLDEPAWDEAQTGWGFRRADPDRFAEASVKTTFKILYDDDALYVGVACWEDDAANVAAYLSRRDEIQASDIVSFYLDPYRDRTTGYNFRVNALGVQQDAYLFDDGDRDTDWNAVWEAEVWRDGRGWYVEMRIPFSQIRFKPEPSMTWGLQVYRWLHGRGEDTGWVLWERDQSGFVSRWGNLAGLEGVGSPRKLEVLPYVVSRHVDPAVDGDGDTWRHSGNFGADFKYGPTANTTLNATFQPDFGQVEADPATLNLSPFETFYAEKRPFFIEGARYFQHPDFNLFYSRRIGTGDPNARIRGAGKLTGKLGGDLSLAALAAATDVAAPGRTHNPFVGGQQKAYYGLVRAGKEFAAGNHSVFVMGTAVARDRESFAGVDDPRLRRDAYSGGADFTLQFADRMYRVHGAAVGTLIEPHDDPLDPSLPTDTSRGTGGQLALRKQAGTWRGGAAGYFESDKLDPNDLGYLAAPDEKRLTGDVAWVYNDDGRGSAFANATVSVDGHTSWLYAGGTGVDTGTGDEAWRYGPDHRQGAGVHVSANGQLRESRHQGWIFLGQAFEGTSKYQTRRFDGRRGPLMTEPAWNAAAAEISTDWRKPWSVGVSYEYDWSTVGSRVHEGQVRLVWNQSQRFLHSLGLGFAAERHDAQWMANLANDGAQPGVAGIGGVDYVFGRLARTTWDLTLRSSVLFDRDHSLQVYFQPFLTHGDYSDPRWLATPDSYDLRPYALDATNYDFVFGAVNLNVVYRWEYRPGSTVYLVWTHAKQRYESGFDQPDAAAWDNGGDPGYPFGTEPENTLLVKLSYWFSI